MDIHQRTKKGILPKVDLTAMVDLGFLLITFFMLASSFAKPKAMEVFKPEQGDPMPVPESKSATIIIGTRDKLYTYSLRDEINTLEGFKFDSVDYSPAGLRNFIHRRQSEVKKMWGSKEKLFVIIKPLKGSSYKNLVDVLDEMLINDVKSYAIAEPLSPVDSLVIQLANEK